MDNTVRFFLADDLDAQQQQRQHDHHNRYNHDQHDQHDQHNQHDYRKAQDDAVTNVNTNNINIRDTQPGVFYSRERGIIGTEAHGRTPYKPTKDDLETIRQAYADNVGALTAVVARMIEEAMYKGLTALDVVAAIEITGLAPRPSGQYLRAVLRDSIANGVVQTVDGGVGYKARWWCKDSGTGDYRWRT